MAGAAGVLAFLIIGFGLMGLTPIARSVPRSPNHSQPLCPLHRRLADLQSGRYSGLPRSHPTSRPGSQRTIASGCVGYYMVAARRGFADWLYLHFVQARRIVNCTKQKSPRGTDRAAFCNEGLFRVGSFQCDSHRLDDGTKRTAVWIASDDTLTLRNTSHAHRCMPQPLMADTANDQSSKSTLSTPGLPITFMRSFAGMVR